MSSPAPVTTGFAFRDSFVYQKADGTFQTGLTQASFTLRFSKDGVGNRSTTGITITEVDATNNPGEYVIVFSSTVFAASGEYVLTVTHTATPAYTWEQVYTASATGLPSASGATFTATAGNGRVYDGAAAVQNATVIVTSGSTVHAVLTSSVTGVWGPVYFSADGTYSVVAQKAGYSSATGTIVVSGGATIATGPGTDLTLAATTVNLLSASELWAYFTRQARDVSGNKADTERKQGVQDALEMLAKEHQWSWLLRRDYLSLKGAVTYTVTLTNSSATVTTADTFATWAADGRVFTQSQVIDVLTRDSGTQLTLSAPWAGATGSYSIVLFQDEYALPDNTLWFHQLIPFQRWAWGGSHEAPETFFQRQSAMIYGQQFPSCWTVHAGNLCLYPYPSADATLAFTYYAQPAQLVSGVDVADWDPAQVEVLRRAIDVQVVNRYGSCAGGDANVIMGRYKEALSRARATDRAPTSTGNAMDDYDALDMRASRAWWSRPRG